MIAQKNINRLLLTLFYVMIVVCIQTVSALEPNDILFYASFDGDTKAEIAKGSAKQASGTVEFVEGIRGQGVLIGGKNGELKYPTAGNFNKDAGTVSLWIKPVDWKRADGKNHNFLAFPGEGPIVQAILLYNYSVGYTWFMIIRPGGNNRFIGEFEPDWEPGKWHHLAATWRKGDVCIYLDGKMQARGTDDIPEMEKVAAEFQVGDRENKTVFDELMIFNRPLMPAEIKALYQRNAPTENSTPQRITMSKTATAPTIDGVLAPGEWDKAATVGNLTDTLLVEPVKDPRSTMAMTFDEKNLYFSLRFAIPEIVRRSRDLFPRGPLKCEVRERDGEIWQDDCFEIVLFPGEGRTQPVYRFGINALGVYADSKNGQKNWNSNAIVKSRVDQKEWFLEVAIPFSDLGVSVPANGAKWHFNLAQHWKVLGNQNGVLTFSSREPMAMGELVFASQAPVVQVSGIGQLDQGQVRIAGQVSNPGNTAAELTLTAQTPGKEINETATLKMGPGESQSFLLRSTIAESIASTLAIEARDSTGNVIYLTYIPFVFRPSLLVGARHFPARDELIVDIDRTGAGTRQEDKSFFAEVTLRGHGSDKALKQSRIGPFTQTKIEVPFDLRDLPLGMYEIAASLTTPDRKLGEKVVQFEKKESPDWLNNKIGITEKVPPPWSPIKVQKDAEKKSVIVSCWGRQYQFEKSLFPSQVITQGKSLLLSPMRLKIRTDQGQETVVPGGDVEVTQAREDQVNLESKSVTGGAKINLKTTIEYDGFAWCEITITPKSKMTIDSLVFEIPYASQYASLFYTGPNSGETIKPEGYTGNCGNYFWVGSEIGGIEWVAETQQGWKISKPDQTLQIIKDKTPGREVVVRINMIDQCEKIERPLTIGFGIQATPVRPKPKGWRNWRITNVEHPKAEQPNVGAKPWILMWNPRWSEYLNYPVINAEWTKLLKRREAEGTRSCLYAQILRTSPIPPEYRYFYEEWRMIPSAQIDFETVFDQIKNDKNPDWTQIGSASVCVKSSFADFYMWHLKRSVKEGDIKGYYYDLTGPEPCSNQEHGCGWVDEKGQVQATWPIRAVREFMKRVYVVLKENDPNAIIGMHMSGRNLMPMDAFCDVMIDGELFSQDIQKQIAAKKRDNYYDILPLDKMRAEYMSDNWGPLTAFLPAFVPGAGEKYHQDAPQDIASIEHLVGLFLLHDSQMWPAWMNGKPLFDVWAAQETFGWDDEVEFIPYWDKRVSEYVTLETGGVQPVVCSIFKRPGKVMLVLFNNSDTDADVMLRLHGDKIGLPNLTGIKDFYSGGFWYGVPGAGSSWKLPLRKRNFRMLVPQ